MRDPKSYYGLTVFAHSLSDPEYRKTSNSTQVTNTNRLSSERTSFCVIEIIEIQFSPKAIYTRT